ncbi:MAG: tryptophan-rich sensory protein [Candidatus Eisenbacteria bacterium]|nr:tryptophan-rich sensory protein [Candidatus Eisenbacteria bacterium]
MRDSRRIDIWELLISLALVAAVAAYGSQFSPAPWYQEIPKPSWTPPGWLFGPVWTALYLMMAFAAWLVWRTRASRAVIGPIAVYVLQLALNGLWSYLFFGLRRFGLALVDLVALWALIAITIVLFWRIRRLAGALLLPYLAWVTFAGFLNHAIWALNR